jgi:hypothetical protein
MSYPGIHEILSIANDFDRSLTTPFPNFLAPLPIELAPQGHVLVKTQE